MSVVVTAVIPGGNADMYEAVNEKVMPGNQLPDGCELHVAGPVEQGWRVITVWDSPEAFDRFREDRLVPAFRELGGGGAPSLPEPDISPVHVVMTA
jgi:hypothetical protein